MVEEVAVDWSAELGPGRGLLVRTTTADLLRRRIADGLLIPGTRLSEEDIGRVLGVSRAASVSDVSRESGSR